jgi:hypothetical protein
MTMVLLLLLSCATARPANEIIVCDGTGREAGAVCTSEFLERELADWARRSGWRPGLRFAVITTGSDTSDTKVWPAIVIPAKAPKGEHGWSDWAAGQGPALQGVAIPADEDASFGAVRSNLIDAVRVAARIARADMAGESVDLVIASDGLAISRGDGVDLEGTARFYSQRKLTPGAAVPRLADSELGWDVGAWSAIRMCGWHLNASAAAIRAREEFWPAAIAAGGGPAMAAAPRTSCAEPGWK